MSTPMSTPADELRTAAAKLRAAAATAAQLSPPPWVVTDEHVIRCSNEERGIVADRSCEPDEAGDLEYIAAMHPGVGAALAELLEHHALHVDAVHKAAANIWPTAAERSERVDWIEKQISTPALAVARQINGSPS